MPPCKAIGLAFVCGGPETVAQNIKAKSLQSKCYFKSRSSFINLGLRLVAIDHRLPSISVALGPIKRNVVLVGLPLASPFGRFIECWHFHRSMAQVRDFKCHFDRIRLDKSGARLLIAILPFICAFHSDAAFAKCRHSISPKNSIAVWYAN